MNTKEIARKNLPMGMPVMQTAVAWLLCDRFAAPGWVYGTVFTLIGIVWIVFAVALFTRKPVDIFEEK